MSTESSTTKASTTTQPEHLEINHSTFSFDGRHNEHTVSAVQALAVAASKNADAIAAVAKILSDGGMHAPMISVTGGQQQPVEMRGYETKI